MAPTLGNLSPENQAFRVLTGADHIPRPSDDQALLLFLVDVADDVLDVVFFLVVFLEEGIVVAFLLDLLVIIVGALGLDGTAAGRLVIGLLQRDGLDRILLQLGLSLDRLGLRRSRGGARPGGGGGYLEFGPA